MKTNSYFKNIIRRCNPRQKLFSANHELTGISTDNPHDNVFHVILLSHRPPPGFPAQWRCICPSNHNSDPPDTYKPQLLTTLPPPLSQPHIRISHIRTCVDRLHTDKPSTVVGYWNKSSSKVRVLYRLQNVYLQCPSNYLNQSSLELSFQLRVEEHQRRTIMPTMQSDGASALFQCIGGPLGIVGLGCLRMGSSGSLSSRPRLTSRLLLSPASDPLTGPQVTPRLN